MDMDDFDRDLVEVIPRLRRYALSLTRSASSADDLVQDVLERALHKKHLFVKDTNLRAWLFTILHNQYVDDARRSARQGFGVDADDVASLLTTRALQEEGLKLEDVKEALATLPQEQQQTIALVGCEGLRYEEVASILNIPVGTVRSRLSRGREKLRLITAPEQHRAGKSISWRLRQLYTGTAIRLRDKALRVTPRSIAKETTRNKRTVENFIYRNDDFARSIGCLTRPYHNIEDYRRAIQRLIDKGIRASLSNLGTELALGAGKAGTVKSFLDNHPKLRAEFASVLTPKKPSTSEST